MECSKLRIPKGNDFTLLVPLNGRISTDDPNVEPVTDVAETTTDVTIITSNGKRITVPAAASVNESHAMLWYVADTDNGKAVAIFVPFNKQRKDKYGLEIIGVSNGYNWQYKALPGEAYEIVDATSEQNIPNDQLRTFVISGNAAAGIMIPGEGAPGVTPHIDPTTKHWMIGTTDTGIVAEAVDGNDGVTPHIDPTTKHWMIGTTDTGIVAEAVDGKDAYEVWKENVTNWNDLSRAGFLAWMKAQADNYEGPVYAASVSGVNQEGKVFYVPGESGGTGETYYVMIYYGGEAHTLSTRSGLPSNFTSVYDISAATSNHQYATLSDALSAIPDDSVKKGGMAIKYINSVTGKYEQYILKSTSFSTTISDWTKVGVSDVEGILHGEPVEVETILTNMGSQAYKCTSNQAVGTEYNEGNVGIPSGVTVRSKKITSAGTYRIYGKGSSGTTFPSIVVTHKNENDVYIVKTINHNIGNRRTNPFIITIEDGERLYVNLYGYDSTTDKIVKVTQSVSDGLIARTATLEAQVNSLRSNGFIYLGIADEDTNPGTPSAKVFYVALTDGTYTNFGGITVRKGITLLKWNGSEWAKDELLYETISEEDIEHIEQLFGSETLLCTFVANAYWKNNGDPGVTPEPGLARTSKKISISDIDDNAEIVLYTNNLGIYYFNYWVGNTHYFKNGATDSFNLKGKTRFTKQDLLAYSGITHFAFSVGKNNESLDTEVVATWNVTQKVKGSLEELQETVQDLQESVNSQGNLTEQLFGSESKVSSFTANKMWKLPAAGANGVTGSFPGGACTIKISIDDIEDGATIKINAPEGYSIYYFSRWTTANYNMYTESSFKGRTSFTKQELIDTFSGITHFSFSIYDEDDTTLDASVVANWSVTQKVSGSLEEIQEAVQDLQESVGNQETNEGNIFHYDNTPGNLSNILSKFGDGTDKTRLELYVSRPNTSWGDNNPCLNFNSVKRISGGSVVEVDGCNDDTCPVNVNGIFIGANHGDSNATKVTCLNHGKTFADIGSVWSNGGNEYVIAGIADSNNIYMLGSNKRTYPLFELRAAPTGTYTHVSGATNADSFTVESSISHQLKPAMDIVSKRIIIDGKEITESGDYKFKRLDICEEYDIFNTASIYDALIANAGTFNSNPVFSEIDGVDRFIKLSLVYSFMGADTWVINSTIIFLQNASISYYGFTQQQVMYVSNNDIKMYIPKVLPIGGLDFRLIADFSSLPSDGVTIATNYWENQLLPPDRWLQYTPSVGLASGYLFDSGVGGSRRKDAINTAFRIPNTRKCYPHGIDTKASSNAYNAYSATVFRRYIPRNKINTGGVISQDTFEYNDALYIYADYNAAGLYRINIPSKYVGKTITVFEKRDNVTLLTEVSQATILIKVAEVESPDVMYGYLVGKIE